MLKLMTGGNMENKTSKIYASLIGFIIGDAIGVPIEFDTRASLINNPISDMLGYGTYNVPAGTWSDCSSLVIATITSIIKKNAINISDITENFIVWYQNGKYTPLDKVFAINHSIEKSLKAQVHNRKRTTIDDDNGALMRILPISLYCYYKHISDNDIVKVIDNVSSITHNDELNKLASFIYTKFICLLHEYDKKEAYEKIKNINYNLYYSNSTIEQFSRILKEDISKIKLSDLESTSYVIDTLESVLWVVLNTDNFIHSIIGAINLGGDTSTIGALTGALSAIIYNYESIPPQWINKLKKLDYLQFVFEKYEAFLLKN